MSEPMIIPLNAETSPARSQLDGLRPLRKPFQGLHGTLRCD